MEHLIDDIDYTIIGSFDNLELDYKIDKALDYGFSRFCFSEHMASIMYDDRRIREHKRNFTMNFPLGQKHAFTNPSIDGLLRNGWGIDIVCSRRDIVLQDIRTFVFSLQEIGERLVDNADIKVIINTDILSVEQIHWTSKKLWALDEVAYIKTCTGFGKRGVVVGDVAQIKVAVPEAKVKASGGIKTIAQVEELYKAGASLFGISSENACNIIDEANKLGEQDDR